MFCLEAVVDDRHQWAAGRADLVRRGDRYLADEVLVLPARHGRTRRAAAASASVSFGCADQRALRTGLAQAPRQRAACPRRRSRARPRRAACARAGAPAPAPRPWPDRRSSPRSHGRRDWSSRQHAPVVADQRIGHQHDLAGVRRVGADLLVAGLGVFATRSPPPPPGRAKATPRNDRAVLERQQRRPVAPDPRVDDRIRGSGTVLGQCRLPGCKKMTAARGRAVVSLQHGLIRPPCRPSRGRVAGLSGPVRRDSAEVSTPRPSRRWRRGI